MVRKALDGLVGSLIEDIKSLNISMHKSNSDEEWKKFNDRIDSTINDIGFVNQACAEELRKEYPPQERSQTSKRENDVVEKAENEGETSKKK